MPFLRCPWSIGALLLVVASCTSAHARILYGPRGVVTNTLVDDGKVWFGQAGGGWTVLDLDSGRILLRREDEHAPSALLSTEEGIVLVRGATSELIDRGSLTTLRKEFVLDEPYAVSGEVVLAQEELRRVEGHSLFRQWTRHGFDRGVSWGRTGRGEETIVVGSAYTGHVECFDAASGRSRWIYRFIPMKQPGRTYLERARAMQRERVMMESEHSDVPFIVDPAADRLRAGLAGYGILAWFATLLPLAVGLPFLRRADRDRRYDRVAVRTTLMLFPPALALHVFGRVSAAATSMMHMVIGAGLVVIVVSLWFHRRHWRERLDLVVCVLMVFFLASLLAQYAIPDWWSARSAVI